MSTTIKEALKELESRGYGLAEANEYIENANGKSVDEFLKEREPSTEDYKKLMNSESGKADSGTVQLGV